MSIIGLLGSLLKGTDPAKRKTLFIEIEAHVEAYIALEAEEDK
jgi:hypothetical protein